MFITNATTFVKTIVSLALSEGDWAVDATVGNGIDTLFMAKEVGPDGHVFGFDIQQSALAKAQVRLESKGYGQNVSLINAGHENMLEELPSEAVGKVKVIMFNCGFLPGSDGEVITKPDTTCKAIDAAIALIPPGGVVTLTMYTGHPGGQEELEAVEAHLKAVDLTRTHVMSCLAHNHRAPKIKVFLLQRKK